jgi:serine/threonine protein phosphatase 1
MDVAVHFKLSCDFFAGGQQWCPSLPEGVKIYVFGDIHGRLDLLDKCLSQIDRNIASSETVRPLLVFLGDYIDRGPRSRETVERLLQLSTRRDCIFLSGNHEQLAIRSLDDTATLTKWLRLGGLETLSSYGIKAARNSASQKISTLQHAFREEISGAHLDFFVNLKSHFSCGDFFFAHAGIKPGVALSDQSERDLLWIRDEFLRSSADFGKSVVHGHTPVTQVEVRANRINIDTGAYATNLLTCLVIKKQELSIIDSSVR